MDASGELSKSAKRRQRAKAAEAAKAEAEAPPAPAPAAAKAKAKADAKAAAKPAAKAASAPKAAPAPKQQASPKQQAAPAAKPKAESKQAAAKKQPAAKSAAQKPRKESEEVARKESGIPPVEVDDGSGGGWEVSTGFNKKVAAKQQRKAAENAEIEKMKAAHGYPTTTKSGAPQPYIPGMAPAAMGKGPGVSQAVGATGAGAAAIAAAKAAGAAVAAQQAGTTTQAPKEAASSAQVKVPEAKIGRVIGPKGANIKLITEKTGCDRIDTTGEMVTITGPPHAVSQAEHAIRELMDKGYMSMAFDNFTEFSIHVHPTVFPDLIGKQGAIIRKIKEELKVEIEIPPVPKDASAKSKKYPVKIAGAAEDVEKAKTVVNDIVMYTHHEVTHPGMSHEELEIASWQYSFIIGKAGSELRHIQNNFKVKVSIPRENSANQNVLVVGEAQDVTRAKAYIEKVIWNAGQASGGRTDVQAADDWGDEEHESWMDAYMYKRR